MAHAASPATLLALARDVFGCAPEARWLTIPVQELGIGENLSPLAQRGVAVAVEEIKKCAAELRSPVAADHRGANSQEPPH